MWMTATPPTADCESRIFFEGWRGWEYQRQNCSLQHRWPNARYRVDACALCGFVTQSKCFYTSNQTRREKWHPPDRTAVKRSGRSSTLRVTFLSSWSILTEDLYSVSEGNVGLRCRLEYVLPNKKFLCWFTLSWIIFS